MALQCDPKELVPIYVSLATTYADDGQHRKAIEMYRKELELRKGHPKEVNFDLKTKCGFCFCFGGGGFNLVGPFKLPQC